TTSLDASERALWFADLPTGRAECKSPLLPGPPPEQSDPWLEVRKTRQPRRPQLPETLCPWLRPEELDDAHIEPQRLREVQTVEPDGSTTRLLLTDHPQIEEEWIGYFVEHWEPWASKTRQWEELHRVYEAVDFMRRQLEEAEERFELQLCV